jgi:hypothetical protein
MSDRELLERAAKAAGPEFVNLLTHDRWDPLCHDDQAFRLAVKLGLVVCVMRDVHFTGVYLPAESIGGKYDEVQWHDNDPEAATRRAIVRAAADIGETQ